MTSSLCLLMLSLVLQAVPYGNGLIGTKVECGSNQECPNFEYCFFAEPGAKGMCLGLDCYKQDDCKEGSFCDFAESVGVRTPRGACAKGSKPPESVLCNRDSMCETSYFCDMTAGPDGNGMCRKRQHRQLHGGITVCYKDIDCPGGRYCDKHDPELELGICRDPPPYVVPSEPQEPVKPDRGQPAPDGQYTGIPCKQDPDCGVNSYCVLRMEPDGRTVGECVRGSRRGEPVYCYDDPMCGAGFRCKLSPNGVYGICIEDGKAQPDGGNMFCYADSDCDPGVKCEMTEKGGMCAGAGGTNEITPDQTPDKPNFCYSNDDCAAERYCDGAEYGYGTCRLGPRGPVAVPVKHT
ncbi:uncharacterized protein LOC118406462 [Branchiostoma floridae]|uniref:Uncharacterized protein LOC118406462 n=1 Tax=Branchiostoma floridae TaxID=7739 RepID=A0A9J7KJX9_BRAFL|nr:uncharacterized protein LOC118406462 [Branchiostoma floridae]